MPFVRSLLIDQGTTFPNYFLTTPVCCPSRSSMLTGKYVHNHRVRFNDGAQGGYEQFLAQGNERPTMATVLNGQGYRTALVGKFMNGYGDNTPYFTQVPPGWDRWYATGDLNYFDYNLAENGRSVHYGRRAEHYQTDVLAGHAREFVRETAAATPLFLYFSIRAPHGELVPAPRHEHEFDGARAPRVPSFNEEDTSDKPDWVGDLLSREQIAEIDRTYAKRLEMLQSADEAVRDLVRTLTESGRLDNMYIFFATDNGYFNGEHREPGGKGEPYEEAIRFPLIVRGPGVAKGATDRRLVANIDLMQTFADLGGRPIPDWGDGRSIVPLLNRTATTWRDAILAEGFSADPTSRRNPQWEALRLQAKVYIEYRTGEKEFYDLRRDEYQMDDGYETLDQATAAWYHDRLAALRRCHGAECRAADTGNEPPPATRTGADDRRALAAGDDRQSPAAATAATNDADRAAREKERRDRIPDRR